MSDTNTNSSNDSMDDIDALLDRNLDDIADLPEFKTFHPGAHKVTINWKRKDMEKTVDNVKKKIPHMELTLTMVETAEHADAAHNDDPAKPGDKCSTLYDLTNENAMGALKKATLGLGTALGTTNLKEILKGTEGFEVLALTKTRNDKNDASRKFLQVENMIVV